MIFVNDTRFKRKIFGSFAWRTMTQSAISEWTFKLYFYNTTTLRNRLQLIAWSDESYFQKKASSSKAWAESLFLYASSRHGNDILAMGIKRPSEWTPLCTRGALWDFLWRLWRISRLKSNSFRGRGSFWWW